MCSVKKIFDFLGNFINFLGFFFGLVRGRGGCLECVYCGFNSVSVWICLKSEVCTMYVRVWLCGERGVCTWMVALYVWT